MIMLKIKYNKRNKKQQKHLEKQTLMLMTIQVLVKKQQILYKIKSQMDMLMRTILIKIVILV